MNSIDDDEFRKFAHAMPPKLAALNLKEGDTVELYDGTSYTVLENPRDGIWIFATDEAGSEHSIDLSEIKSMSRPT